MEEIKSRFIVWGHDYYGGSGRKILGYVNTFAEGQELLVSKWKKNHRNLDECKKEIEEILSHTEEELVGRDELTLYGGSVYFHEGIARVPGYVDDDEKVSESVTLGEILKRELAEVGKHNWKLEFSEKKDECFLQIEGRNKVFVGNKYEHIVGLPTYYVWDYWVYSGMGKLSISNKDFQDVDWNVLSVDEIDSRLVEYFHVKNNFFSEEEAINSLPNELVLDKHHGTQSISPYDQYGYHIEQISAYGNGQGVFIHIKK